MISSPNGIVGWRSDKIMGKKLARQCWWWLWWVGLILGWVGLILGWVLRWSGSWVVVLAMCELMPKITCNETPVTIPNLWTMVYTFLFTQGKWIKEVRKLEKKWQDSVNTNFDSVDDAGVDAKDACDWVLGYSVFLRFWGHGTPELLRPLGELCIIELSVHWCTECMHWRSKQYLRGLSKGGTLLA